MKLPVKYSETHYTIRKLVREQYILEQNGLCYWCGGSLDSDPPQEIINKPLNMALFPPNFLKYPIHLQHNHDTDFTEGAVHARCNGVMWQYHNR